jgi:hypothetical protein
VFISGDPALFDHLTLLEYEEMQHDVDAIVAYGFPTDEATHLAALWYACGTPRENRWFQQLERRSPRRFRGARF